VLLSSSPSIIPLIATIPNFLSACAHTHKAKLRNLRFSGQRKSTKSLYNKKTNYSVLHVLKLAVPPIGMYCKISVTAVCIVEMRSIRSGL